MSRVGELGVDYGRLIHWGLFVEPGVVGFGPGNPAWSDLVCLSVADGTGISRLQIFASAACGRISWMLSRYCLLSVAGQLRYEWAPPQQHREIYRRWKRVLTLATIALLRELRNFGFCFDEAEQSAGLLSKNYHLRRSSKSLDHLHLMRCKMYQVGEAPRIHGVDCSRKDL
ncbi:hypothetical protein Tco_0731261 [Tanacetum coccineum]